ncbi:hypothetical protein ACP70R_041029 [Stipagrostis hirtigluma subsp. patula]
MKFCSLSSGVANRLPSSTDGSKLDIPFELTEQEKEIIQFSCTSFILGRSGIGKTTVLTMKLMQKEQQYLIACKGLGFEEADLSGDNYNNCLVMHKDLFASDDFSDRPSRLKMHDIGDDNEEFNDTPDSFSNIPQTNYPLAITFRKFLTMLDGTLPYIATKEVDYEKFSCSYWPHFNAKLTKDLDASTVFKQIISHIKGGNQASKSPNGKLEKQDYIMLFDRRFPSLRTKTRDKIYDIYLCYEKKKCAAGEFDLSDFVNSLYSRLSTDSYSGDMVDFIYIDEVQDLAMNQIALLKYVCSNYEEGFIFAGDAAQTIARGIDFRFEDIRSFFYIEFHSNAKHGKMLHVSDMFQLSQNFRTHYLNPETSHVHGDTPLLLESFNGENALTTIFGGNNGEQNERNMFGADQVIVARDDTTREHVAGIVGKQAIVLTILEAKGLEFEDNDNDQLDASLVQEMQIASSTDDWRLRGIKFTTLFNEKQFGMAEMCFQKAGDEHREKLARAADLVSSGERLVSGNWRRGQTFFVQAAKIYDSIGKHEKAATCYIKSRDFMKAGLVYLEKCGDSRLEDAGECFAIAKSWLRAANAYFGAECYTKCFSMCLKGEHFYLGLKFLHQMEEAGSFEGPNSSELNAARSKYLEKCASYYFHRKDIKHMMQFVKALKMMDEVRAFLFSRTLFNELLLFEMEMGNFIEAADTAVHIGSILLWTGTPSFGDVTQIILLNVIMNILWTSHVKARYQKGYLGHEQLLKKARELVQKVSNLYFPASLEADALCDPRKSLANMSNNLLVGSKQGNIPVKFFAARSMLDIHLLFRSSCYTFELNPTLGDSHNMLTRNQISPKSLIYLWNCWKSVVFKALSRDVRHVPFQTTGRVSLPQDSNRCRSNVNQDWSSVWNYWTNELYSVGISVLNKSESLARICSKQEMHPYVQGLIVLAIYEIAKFLRDTKFSGPKNADKSRDFFVLDERHNNTDKFRNFCVLSEDLLFDLVFHDWKDETCTLLYILNIPTVAELLLQSLNSNVALLNLRLTCEQLRRVTTLLLLSAKLDDRMISSLMQYMKGNSEWARFFRALKSFLDGGRDGARLLMRLPSMLEYRSKTKRLEVDYASPVCYDYLMKWFSLLASSYTKTVLIEVLKSWDDDGYLGGCMASCHDLHLDYTAPVYGPIQWPTVGLIKTLLSKRSMLQEWIHKTSASFYLPILLNFVISLYIKPIGLQLGDPYEVSDFLSTHGVLNVLPQGFSHKIQNTMFMRPCTINDFTKVFADALAAMGNHLAVIGLLEGCLICYDLIACIVSSIELRNAEESSRKIPCGV